MNCRCNAGLLLLAIVAGSTPASAQTFVATRAPNPCPPGGVVVRLPDGRQSCAQTSRRVEHPLPRASTSIINGERK
jgi:hypothetical protein